ncbi:MAG TPA: hypothetical protein VN937_00290 [Blastocatellia bacterium]|nr:hypothetical protein [Blastocatellia bacterium]
MSKDSDWIATCVDAARVRAPVTAATTIRLEGLLVGPLGERQLRPLELTAIANALIEDMVTSDDDREELSDEN